MAMFCARYTIVAALFVLKLLGQVDAYDVLIVGGSAAGLSAALSLGRSRRSVLVIDEGSPCNAAQPFSFNFLTADGVSPSNIAKEAFESVAKYDTVDFCRDAVVDVSQDAKRSFQVVTGSGAIYRGRSLVIATGMVDELPEVPGAKECWGKSLIHCPYCHGYEFRDKPTALWMSASNVVKMAPIIHGLSKDLTVITNVETLEESDLKQLSDHNVPVIDSSIVGFEHIDGYLLSITLENDQKLPVEAVYIRPPLQQSLEWTKLLPGLEMVSGYLKVDSDHGTNIEGVFAAGDCTTTNRALSIAVASGTKAAKMLNFKLAMWDWES